MQEKKETQKANSKNNFFNRVLMSIKDFDKYEIFAGEKLGQTLIYLIQLIAIFSIILTGVLTYQFSQTLEKVITTYNEKISSLKYENYTLQINDNTELKIDNLTNLVGEIIINTSDLNEQEIKGYSNELENYNNAIVVLKDGVLIKNSSLDSVAQKSYKDLFANESTESKDKETILNDYYAKKSNIYIAAILLIYMGVFITYVTNILLDALLLGLLGYITAKIARVELKYAATFNIAAHSLTLPLILNVIYAIINLLTGFTIKYFQIMYSAISYIYIITAILMIKSDLVKRQIDLQKIQDEQQKIKEELEDKEVERKRKEEKERVKDKDKNSNKDNNENQQSPTVGDKPAGNDV